MSDGTENRSQAKKFAAAIQYGSAEEIPRVIESGVGEVAKRIVELARRNNIPVKEDGVLSEMLATLRPGSTITPESYHLIAEIISFLYHTDQEWRKKHAFLDDVIPPQKVLADPGK